MDQGFAFADPGGRLFFGFSDTRIEAMTLETE